MNSLIRYSFYLTISTVLLLTACGKENPADGGTPPPPPPQEDPMRVGTGGGNVSNSDSTVTLSIPSGSLSSEVTFTIGETTSHPGNAVGTVYDIGPDGTQFNPAATLSIKYDETDLPSGARKGDLRLVTAENGSWKELTTTVNEQNNTVSADISHLSIYGILWDNPNIVAEEGGTIASADSTVVLEIPEGALFEETTFTFEETTTHPEGAIGKVYDIGPDGAQFELPVTLTFSYDEAALPEGTSEEDLEIAVEEAGQWKHLTTSVNTAENELSTEITHLSVYGIVVSSPSKPLLTMYVGRTSENQQHFGHSAIQGSGSPRVGFIPGEFHMADQDDPPSPLFDSWTAPCSMVARSDSFRTEISHRGVDARSSVKYKKVTDREVVLSYDGFVDSDTLIGNSQAILVESRSTTNLGGISVIIQVENPTGKSIDLKFSWLHEFEPFLETNAAPEDTARVDFGNVVRRRIMPVHISTKRCDYSAIIPFEGTDPYLEHDGIIEPNRTTGPPLAGTQTITLDGSITTRYLSVSLTTFSRSRGFWRNDGTYGRASIGWQGKLNISLEHN